MKEFLKLIAPAVAVFFIVFALLADPASGRALSSKDRLKMIDAVTAIAAGADRHDWRRVRQAFADEVTLDYTSLWGGEAATTAADDIVAQWSNFLPGFDETLHLVTNHTVTAFTRDTATMEADFQAAHRIGDEMWVLMGHYTYGLRKSGGSWRVDALTMTWTHETGDRGLVGRAAERAGQKGR